MRLSAFALTSFGILVISAFSTIVPRSPGMLLREIRQSPGVPGRLIVLKKMFKISGPRFELFPTEIGVFGLAIHRFRAVVHG
jgi:hypothetical protein